MTLAVLRCPDTLCWQFYLKIGFCIFKSWNQPFRCQSFADGKGLNMQNFISFCLHKMTSWIFWAVKNMLNTVKGLWLRENGRKNDSLAAHLIFRARGSDEHFLLTRTQLHTGEGRAPSLSFKCSGNIWSGINIWCTMYIQGHHSRSVDCNFFWRTQKFQKVQ